MGEGLEVFADVVGFFEEGLDLRVLLVLGIELEGGGDLAGLEVVELLEGGAGAAVGGGGRRRRAALGVELLEGVAIVVVEFFPGGVGSGGRLVSGGVVFGMALEVLLEVVRSFEEFFGVLALETGIAIELEGLGRLALGEVIELLEGGGEGVAC